MKSVINERLKNLLIILGISLQNPSLESRGKVIEEICNIILNPDYQIFFDLNDIELFQKDILLIQELSSKIVSDFEKESAKDIISQKKDVPYLSSLKSLVLREINLLEIKSISNVLFVGSGALPTTAFEIVKNTKASVCCLDIDKEAISLSKKLSHYLCIQNISFKNGNIQNINLKDFDIIIAASLIPQKDEIINAFLKNTSCNTKLLLRYGNKIKSLFNYPIDFKSLCLLKKRCKLITLDNSSEIYSSLILEKKYE